MPLEAAILEAVRSVEEPELRLSLGELGVLTDVVVTDADAVVRLATPFSGEWAGPELARRVERAAGAVTGAGHVSVECRPMNDAEMAALARVLKREPPPNPLAVVDANRPAPPRPRTNPFTDASTRVLAVSSGKGGVGKSSVTTNLSIALAARGLRVAAVDADVWGFSMPRMLGIDRPPALIDDVIVPPSAHGVRLVSMGFFAPEDQAVIWRGPMLHKALEQFLTDVWWGDLDYLVIDMPPGTGDVALSMAQFLPHAEVIVVTTPQPAAQSVAQRAAAMARKVELSVLGVIENMSWFIGDDQHRYELFGQGGGAALAEALGVPLLGQVPLVAALREGGDTGSPIVVDDPGSEVAQVFHRIAETIA